MRKSFTVLAAVVLSAMVAAAQDVPRFETFLGYQYVHGFSGDNVPSFTANGGGGQFVYNFSKWVGAVADVGAVHNGSIPNFGWDATIVNFIAGPRVSWRNDSRFTPFGQVLIGGAWGTFSRGILATPVGFPNDVVRLRLTDSRSGFAMTAGGGLDIRVTKHVSLRPASVEYFMTRLGSLRTPGDETQNNIRYMAGVNFTFGAR